MKKVIGYYKSAEGINNMARAATAFVLLSCAITGSAVILWSVALF